MPEPRIVTTSEHLRTTCATWAVVAITAALIVAGVALNIDWSLL